MRYISSYRNSAYPFPEDAIDPQKKLEPSWLLAVAQAVYSKFTNDRTVFTYTDQEKFDVQRKYGQGRQSTDRYKEHYKPTQSPGDRAAKGYVNLDWTILSLAPKFKAVIRQKMKRIRAEPQVRAIDEMSGAEREDMKWGSYFHSLQGDLINDYERATGLKVDKPSFLPSSLEELEIFSEISGFKIKSEIAYNRALKYTDVLSDWDVIERKLQDDLTDVGACCAKDYVDQEDGKVKMKYIDIARFVGDYSLNHGFAKSRYFGHFEDYTIAELRYFMPDEPEDKFKELASQYSGYSTNPVVANFDIYDVQKDNGVWGYDDYIITVFEGEYLTVDTKYRTKHTNRYGDVKYYDDIYGTVRNTDTKKTTKRSVRKWYKFNWIVGSDLLFDSGLQSDVPRPDKSKPRSSYHPYRVVGRSFIEIIKTNLDQIQLAYLKMQQALAASNPDGLAIQWDALENISIGDEETNPMEILRIHQQTGNLIYKATTHRGEVNVSQTKPVIPLQGGAGKMFEDSIRTMEFHFNIIAEVTGIDRYSAGLTPTGETSATASQIANIGSEDIINDLSFGFKEVRKSVALNVVHRIALRVKHSSEAYDIYYPALGHNTHTLKLSADSTPLQMGIYMRIAPNIEQRQRISDAAKNALGAGQIEFDEYLKIERTAEDGNLLFAEAMLHQNINKRKEQEQKNQQENINTQNEGLKAIKEEENKGMEAKIGMEKDAKIEVEKAKGAQTRRTNQELHDQTMKQIHAEKGLDNQNAELESARQTG